MIYSLGPVLVIPALVGIGVLLRIGWCFGGELYDLAGDRLNYWLTYNR